MPTGTPFSVSEEQRALRSAIADLMARHSSEAQVRTLMATDMGLDPKVWHELAAMGHEIGLHLDPFHMIREYGDLYKGTADALADMRSRGLTIRAATTSAVSQAAWWSTMALGFVNRR